MTIYKCDTFCHNTVRGLAYWRLAMQFSLAQEAARSFGTFLSDPWADEDFTVLKISEEQATQQNHLMDWLLIWLLSGGDGRCAGDFTIFLQAVALILMDHTLNPGLYGGRTVIASPAKVNPEDENHVYTNADDVLGPVDRQHVVPLALSAEFFELVKTLSREQKRRYSESYLAPYLS